MMQFSIIYDNDVFINHGIEEFGLLKEIFKRLLHLMPIFLGITLVVFLLMHVGNMDAVDALYDKNGAVSASVKAAGRAELGLDKPLIYQYGDWLLKIMQGDMGTSYINGGAVMSLMLTKLPATIELMLLSLVLTFIVAIPGGVVAALYKDSWFDYTLRLFSFIGNSLPNFLAGLLLLYIFSWQLKIFPIIAGDHWDGIVLPALTLTIAMSSRYTRQVRTLVLEELSKPYVLGLKSRGIGDFYIIKNSVWPGVLPALINLAVMSAGSLLGGAVIVETIFAWDGIGKFALEAIMNRDLPVVQAYVLWLAFIYVWLNLAADIYCNYRGKNR